MANNPQDWFTLRERRAGEKARLELNREHHSCSGAGLLSLADGPHIQGRLQNRRSA
jgi:hypothetical protein